MYLFRLDDASEYMDVEKWTRVERIFDHYQVKPIVGIIPHNEDPKLVSRYGFDDTFWEKARAWKKKNWRIALHGYNHVYVSQCGGIHPVNNRSEFAGVPLEQQREKIRKGYAILCGKGLQPDVFFAPAHTFDENTLLALQEESNIRIISDTVANDVYCENEFHFIPQQTGTPRKLPLKLVTICLHPNTMDENDMAALERFIKENHSQIVSAYDVQMKDRKYGLIDRLLKKLYFLKRI